MKVTVTGATGTLGSALVAALTARGDEVTALSRSADSAREKLGAGVTPLEWEEPQRTRPSAEALRGRDGVVHLLGEQIAQRWSDSAKKEIRDSRVLSTRNLVEAVGALPGAERPAVLVSQSGSSRYGARGDERVEEDAGEPAQEAADFLTGVCREWEAEALAAVELGLRVVVTRTGPVLSKSGMLEKMMPPFKLGVGGPVAGGHQYVPWVHTDDVVGALVFCLDTGALKGPVNVTAPDPATNAELSKALGRVLHRPAFTPVPAFALKVLYGEMAVMVTDGVRAVPAKLTEAGYEFRRPDLEDALRAATGR